MDEIIERFQNQLQANVPGLNHIDEDWGQMDYYDKMPPVKFPGALVDIQNSAFTNDGELQQKGLLTVVVKLYVLRLGNTSTAAPQGQKNAAKKGWQLYTDINKALHGQEFLPEGFGAPVRTNMQRIKRSDGVYERDITYTIGFTDASCIPQRKVATGVKPTISLVKV